MLDAVSLANKWHSIVIGIITCFWQAKVLGVAREDVSEIHCFQDVSCRDAKSYHHVFLNRLLAHIFEGCLMWLVLGVFRDCCSLLTGSVGVGAQKAATFWCCAFLAIVCLDRMKQ